MAGGHRRERSTALNYRWMEHGGSDADGLSVRGRTRKNVSMSSGSLEKTKSVVQNPQAFGAACTV